MWDVIVKRRSNCILGIFWVKHQKNFLHIEKINFWSHTLYNLNPSEVLLIFTRVRPIQNPINIYTTGVSVKRPYVIFATQTVITFFLFNICRFHFHKFYEFLYHLANCSIFLTWGPEYCNTDGMSWWPYFFERSKIIVETSDYFSITTFSLKSSYRKKLKKP